MKHAKGFTFVEAIVVVTVVGVLSIVAAPAYLSYVKNARQDAVTNMAQTASTAANSYYRKTGNDPSVPQLNLFYDTATYAISVSAPNVTVSNKIFSTVTKSLSYR